MAANDSGDVVNVETLASMVYGVDEPSKAQRNGVAKLCREGRVPAVKVGRRWLIRLPWPDDEREAGR
jgi:hypothetical protein